ncbi:hypothetical protein IGI04_031415 [Brassica rapa subsp. trilocularis]|uniref:Uncharacterized protein n=1 Tax=Brassica rapa subsp. trilocularis TaxID=1813537 RepID=A0ABQ7LTJ2_BRACM|nr:hypothetical protein IGI04_031415 [Brassica rapa subsp. trilocularis]
MYRGTVDLKKQTFGSVLILSKIRSLLSRHNDEQPLNITGQVILRGQNGYFQSGQVSYRFFESLKQAGTCPPLGT